MTERIQLRRTKGWRMPPNTVKVARPTSWGNPFRTGDRAADVAAYERCVSTWPVPHENLAAWQEAGGSTVMLVFLAARVQTILASLRDKNLACWCPLVDENGDRVPCHADVLLALVSTTFGD